MPLLFSYGTLQQDEVQLAVFRRRLRGEPDALPAYELSEVRIVDPQIAAALGRAHHANITFNGRADAQVAGIVFDVTEAELDATDRYEVAARYTRGLVTLASGRQAWAYRDASNGWDAAAAALIANRNPAIGVTTVREWARRLPAGASILDLGCGSGAPLAMTLASDGFRIFGVDPSATLIAAFTKNIPGAAAACEPAETSAFFGRHFDGVMAIGLMFLLPPETQRLLIRRVAQALDAGGRFLFSSPRQECTWRDLLTGGESRSLGAAAYAAILSAAGLEIAGEFVDEGDNDYYDAIKI